MRFHPPQMHYQLTRAAIALGPGNGLVKSLVRRRCRSHGVQVEFHPPSYLELVIGDRAIRISAAHWLYAPTIAEAFDTYFRQVDPVEINGLRIVDYSRPQLHRYRPSGLLFETNSFPEEVSAIDDYFRWYLPTGGDLVFDLGAYCGVSTYAFSKRVGIKGRVIAFEPDATSFELLQRNIARHRLENVTPICAAIAATSGEAEFHQEGTLGSGLSSLSPRATTGVVDVVQTMSLSDACSQFGVPAFMKIDIEGAEVEVLDHSREFLRENDVQFALDTHHWVGGVRTTQMVEKILLECGYQTLSSDDSGFWTTWARKGAPSDEISVGV